ncbi:hypothetical protein [Pseudomonas extremaustralis]
MRVNLKRLIGGLVIAATILFSSISNAGVSLANDTRNTILNLNVNSKEDYEPDAKDFILCQNFVYQLMTVTSPLLKEKEVLSAMGLLDCKTNPTAVYMSEYTSSMNSTIFEICLLIILSGMVCGLFIGMFNGTYKVLTRSVVLLLLLCLFVFVLKSILYLLILKMEARSTRDNVNFIVGLSKNNAEYSMSTHDDLMADNAAVGTFFNAKVAELRTGPAKLIKNLDASISSLTPLNAAKQVAKNAKYELETDKEGLIVRSAEIATELRKNWPDSRMPVSHVWVSTTNDGFFTSDKENFPSTLLTYGYGFTPSSEIGNRSTDANGLSTKVALTKAVANAPKSNVVAIFKDIKAKIKPSFLAGTTEYQNMNFSYIVDNLTNEQVQSLSSVINDFKEDLSGVDLVSGLAAASSINAASQKGAGGEVVALFKEIEQPTIDGLSFLCSQNSQKKLELNRQITSSLNKTGNSISSSPDLGHLDFACTLITENGYQPLGFLNTELEQSKEAAANANASAKALSILFNAVDKAQASAAHKINLANESSNLVKQIRMVSLGTTAAPAATKYAAGSTNTAVQLIQDSITNNIIINSNAATSPNLFDEDAVFGTNEIYDTEAGEKEKQRIRDIMGRPKFEIFFNKSAVSDVRNISAGKDAIQQSMVDKFQNRMNNIMFAGIPDDLRYGTGIPKNKDLYNGAWDCVMEFGCNDTPTIYEFGIFFGQQLVTKGGVCMVAVHTVRTLFEVFKVEKIAEKAGGLGKKAGWILGAVTFLGKAAVGMILVIADTVYPYCVGMFIFGFTEGYLAPALIDFSYLPYTIILTIMFVISVTYLMPIAIALDIFNPDYRLIKAFGKRLIGILVAIPLLGMIFKITIALLGLPSSVILLPLIIMGGGMITVNLVGVLIIITIVAVLFFVMKEILSSPQKILPDLFRAFEIGGEKLFQDRGFFEKTNQTAIALGASGVVVNAIEKGSKELSDKVAKPIVAAYEKRQAAEKAAEESKNKGDKEVDFKDLGSKPEKK